MQWRGNFIGNAKYFPVGLVVLGTLAEETHEQRLLTVEYSYLGKELAPPGISFEHYDDQAKADGRHIVVRTSLTNPLFDHNSLGHGLCVICCCPMPVHFLCPPLQLL